MTTATLIEVVKFSVITGVGVMITGIVAWGYVSNRMPLRLVGLTLIVIVPTWVVTVVVALRLRRTIQDEELRQ